MKPETSRWRSLPFGGAYPLEIFILRGSLTRGESSAPPGKSAGGSAGEGRRTATGGLSRPGADAALHNGTSSLGWRPAVPESRGKPPGPLSGETLPGPAPWPDAGELTPSTRMGTKPGATKEICASELGGCFPGGRGVTISDQDGGLFVSPKLSHKHSVTRDGAWVPLFTGLSSSSLSFPFKPQNGSPSSDSLSTPVRVLKSCI